MAYSSLTLEKETLQKINRLYETMNKGGMFKSKSTFIDLIADFFLENTENRKALLRFWIEKNPELMAVISMLLEGNGQGTAREEENRAEKRSSFDDELKEVIEEFKGIEDKEI